MFKLYDIVKLKNNRPDLGINKNNAGTVIDIIKIEDGELYTVEFFDENNETIEDSIFVYFEDNQLLSVESPNEMVSVKLELASGT
ncbi:MAG: DUF4926 domain-containing protein [Oscillospiraceae bacterium]|nr:DUF4926 domain-containing protein [Oscillospiraceae bacterium]